MAAESERYDPLRETHERVAAELEKQRIAAQSAQADNTRQKVPLSAEERVLGKHAERQASADLAAQNAPVRPHAHPGLTLKSADMGDLVVNPTIRWTRSAGIEQSPDHKTEPSPTGRAQHNIRTKDDARTAADGQIREANADGLRVGEAVKQPNPITNASTQEQSPRHRDIQTPRTGAFGPSSTASAGRPQPIGGTQRLATGAVRAVTTFAKAVLSFFESIASLFEQVLGGGHSRLDREETAERREEPEPEFAPDLQADNVRAEEATHTQRSQELMRRHGVAILPEQAHHLDVERGRER